MRLHPIDFVFWCAPPLMMIAIAAYMLRGRLQREFPVFFNYLVFQIAAFAVELSFRSWQSYYFLNWVITAMGVFFGFAVLVELVQKVVDGTNSLPHWNISLLCWCGLAAVVVIEMWPPASFFDNFMRGMLEVNRTVDVAELALAFFMVMFGAAVGISRKNLTFGIAVGFGFFATVRLCVIVLFPHRTLVSGMTLRRVGSAAYVISTLIWLAYVTLETNDTDLRGLS